MTPPKPVECLEGTMELILPPPKPDEGWISMLLRRIRELIP